MTAASADAVPGTPSAGSRASSYQKDRLKVMQRKATAALERASEAAGTPSLSDLVRAQLRLLGEDPDRPGLARTPERVEKSLRWLLRGYGMSVDEIVGDGVFEAEHDEMVIVKDIEIYSMCEHHMLPFFGKAHIAYIPDGRIVGFSKLPRIVDVFARRLQVQERLTDEVADAIEQVLRPKGVGVVIEACHLCMMMRGVEKQNSKTITSSVRGVFRRDQRTREEFLRLVRSHPLIS